MSGSITYQAAARAFALRSSYNPELVTECHALTGARYSRDDRSWHCPSTVSNIEKLSAMAERFGLNFPADQRVAAESSPVAEAATVGKSVDVREVSAASGEGVDLLALSSATDAPADPIEIPGLASGAVLRGYQQAGVKYLVACPRSIESDEMGLGKTLQTLAAIHSAEALPALVIAPATLTLNWRDEVGHWFPGTTTQVLKTGKTKLDRGVDFTIASYGIAKTRAYELQARGFKAVVCDGAHYLKNAKAQRTQAIATLAHSIARVHLLTGTPVTNRPADLISPLKILGRLDHDFGGWHNFATRYCQAERTRYGWDLSGAVHLDELATKLRSTCLVRREKTAVLTELPAKTRVVQRLDVNRVAYRDAERGLVAAIKTHSAERVTAHIEASRTGDGVGCDDGGAAALVELGKMLHEAGRAKVPAAVEAIEDYVESGRKVVVFAHHHDVLDAIASGLGDVSFVRIDGTTSNEARHAAVERFQGDAGCKVFLATTKTGGVGITLTAASDVLVVEQEWVPADLDQAEDRCHRIGQTNAVQAVHLIATETVDEKILGVVEGKREVAKAALASGDGAGVDTALRAA